MHLENEKYCRIHFAYLLVSVVTPASLAEVTTETQTIQASRVAGKRILQPQSELF